MLSAGLVLLADPVPAMVTTTPISSASAELACSLRAMMISTAGRRTARWSRGVVRGSLFPAVPGFQHRGCADQSMAGSEEPVPGFPRDMGHFLAGDVAG